MATNGNSYKDKLLIRSLNDTAEYIWGVQTIDQRYIGSEFTQADTFALKVREIKVSGSGNSTTVVKNGTLQIKADVSSKYALDKSVNWSISSDDADTASINTDGLLTALSNGTITVRATANDGSEVYGETEITISNQSSYVFSTKENLFKVYPNPSNNGFVVDLMEANSTSLLTIFDICGSQIYQYETKSNDKVKLEASIFKNTGIFIMTVLQDGQTKTCKLVVE